MAEENGVLFLVETLEKKWNKNGAYPTHVMS